MNQQVTLKDVSERVDYGVTTSAVLHGSGPRFLRITDIDNSFIDWAGVPRCEISDRDTAKYQLSTGDIVVARTGASTGRSQWVEIDEPAVFASYLVRFRVTEDFNSRFIGYVLGSTPWHDHVAGIAHGKSAQPNMSASEMARFEFQCPPKPQQDAIAEVLGALDDKIAANTKLAATADDLATSLFHEALTDAEWSDKTFADIAQVTGGGTPSTKILEYWDGHIPWATPTDITGLTGPYLESTSRSISADGLSACASPLYPTGSILMTSRATIGAFAMAQIPTAVNQGFIVVQPNDPTLDYWIFHEMRSRVDEFISMANGATFLELSRGNFKKFKVRLAPEPIMTAFAVQARALHDAARTALLENTKLASIRDTLLPQLMSGKLRVKDAEALVSAAV